MLVTWTFSKIFFFNHPGSWQVAVRMPLALLISSWLHDSCCLSETARQYGMYFTKFILKPRIQHRNVKKFLNPCNGRGTFLVLCSKLHIPKSSDTKFPRGKCPDDSVCVTGVPQRLGDDRNVKPRNVNKMWDFGWFSLFLKILYLILICSVPLHKNTARSKYRPCQRVNWNWYNSHCPPHLTGKRAVQYVKNWSSDSGDSDTKKFWQCCGSLHVWGLADSRKGSRVRVLVRAVSVTRKLNTREERRKDHSCLFWWQIAESRVTSPKTVLGSGHAEEVEFRNTSFCDIKRYVWKD
jgi:hypothetical protein